MEQAELIIFARSGGKTHERVSIDLAHFGGF
jgi:hypothetical protein